MDIDIHVTGLSLSIFFQEKFKLVQIYWVYSFFCGNKTVDLLTVVIQHSAQDTNWYTLGWDEESLLWLTFL